jgi:hypothetical protein
VNPHMFPKASLLQIQHCGAHAVSKPSCPNPQSPAEACPTPTKSPGSLHDTHKAISRQTRHEVPDHNNHPSSILLHDPHEACCLTPSTKSSSPARHTPGSLRDTHQVPWKPARHPQSPLKACTTPTKSPGSLHDTHKVLQSADRQRICMRCQTTTTIHPSETG